MAFFPIGIKLEGRTCLIAGGGSVALRKTAALLDFGGIVTVVAPRVEGQFKALQKRFPRELTIVKRNFKETDLEECYLAVAATDDREINHRIAVMCQENGILVNVVDQPQECSFFFPAIVKKGDVTVSVSTSGSSPLLSRYIRQQIQEQLPEHIGTISETMEEYRGYVIEKVPDQKMRRDILKQMMQRAFEKQDGLSKEEIDEMIAGY